MSTAGSTNLLRFGVFEIDLRTGELRKAGRKIGIQEQPLRVLVALLGRPGEMLTREELRNRVWASDTFVDFDTGLNKAVKKIREALGDSAESPVFIETVPRRGYRFIAPVETAPEMFAPAPSEPVPAVKEETPAGASTPKRDSRWRQAVLVLCALGLAGLAGWAWWMQNHSAPPASIAVLPLENLSNNADQEYFADGITDELITELAKIGSLRVISRTSVIRYRRSHKPLAEIARELGANAVVEGTVLRSGDRVRVTAQLIDTAKDQHIWAQSYEQSLGDILDLQSHIAKDIAAHVNARLTASEQQRFAANRRINPAAYDDYLKGRFFWNKRTEQDAKLAIHYFEQAIAAQLDYAEAYAGIAEAYVVLGLDRGTMPPGEAFPKARRAAVKALEIDGSSSAGHTAMMWVDLFQWKFREAAEEAQEAIRLSPNSSTAHHHYARLLAITGRFDESLAESRRSVELDPLDPIAGGGVAWNSYLARRYDKAIEQSLKMIEMHPEMDGYYEFIGWCYEAQGRFPEAIQALQQAYQLGRRSGGFRIRLWSSRESAGRLENHCGSCEVIASEIHSAFFLRTGLCGPP